MTMTPPNGEINLRSPGNTSTASPTGAAGVSSPSSTTSPAPTSASKTNSTPSNNYAAPNTPIASAKRPRNHNNASAIKSNGKLHGRRSRSSIGTSQHTYGREIVMNQDSSNKKKGEEPLTPVRKMRLSDGNRSSNNDNIDNKTLNNRIQMSPMHKPRPAVEKDDKKKKGELDGDENEEEAPNGDSNENNSNNNKWVGIFSPVLNFLNHSNEDGADEEPNVDADGDVAMENPTQLKSDVVQEEGEIDNEAPTPTSAATYSVSLPHSQSSMDASEEYGVPEDDMEDDANYDQESEVHGEEDDEDEDEDEFNPYLFIKFLPPYHVSVPHPENKICLPPKDKSDPPITLVLDLDETLVHCTVEPIPDASMIFPVYFNGMQYNVHVRTRPYLQEFLESVSKKFEVVVFTASQKVYADELLNRIDPGETISSHLYFKSILEFSLFPSNFIISFHTDGKYIKHRMFRESCLLVEGNYIKDLNVLGRDLTSSVLVDNSPHAFGYQVDNGIPIESWFDDPNDLELMKLDRFLNTLHGVKDVRASVRSKFQTYKLVRDAR